MSKQAFISYNAEADGEFAQKLASDLENLGLRVWIAPQSINTGESFPSAISRGLSESSYFILVVTPSSLGSRWVQLETDAALELETKGTIRVIPLEVKRSVLPPLLSAKQAISFAGGYLKGLSELCKTLGLDEPALVGASRQDSMPLQTRYGQQVVASDPFVEGALVDLARSMTIMGYLMSRVEATPQSIISAIIEDKTSLRIGISIHSDPDLRTGELLALISQELAQNRHGVSGIFAIQQSRDTEMQPYQLNDSATCNAMHVRWNEMDGREPLGQGIAVFFDELRGRRGGTRR